MSDPILVGGPLRDAAEPSHGVEPHHCTVCATTGGLRPLPLDGPPRHICSACFPAVMHRIGPPSHPGAVNTCTSRTAACPNSFGVVAVWPSDTLLLPGTPSIRACSHHLAEAVAGLVADRANTSESQS